MNHNRTENRGKERDFPSYFRDFPDFWHSYPAEEIYELLNAAADIDCPSDVVGQSGQGELGGDFLPALRD